MKDIVIVDLIGDNLKKHSLSQKIIEILKNEKIEGIEFAEELNSTVYILNYFNEYKKIIVIDSIIFGLKPGTLYKLTPNDISNINIDKITTNRIKIHEFLRLANFMRATTKVVIIGIEPEKKDKDEEFSKEFLDKIHIIVNEIKKEILKL
jgi:hydrogenase maturation protease